MPRIARIVVPGIPHHVIQRGARRMRVFFSSQDYQFFLELLREATDRHGVQVWAYCLMPNHVHLLLTPQSAQGLAAVGRSVHQAYAETINHRFGWKGHLWQERFGSFPMDEVHLLRAARYVLLNPVRAGLVARAADWPASSAREHLGLRADPLVCASALGARVLDWEAFLAVDVDPEDCAVLRRAGRTGRPLGDVAREDEGASSGPSEE